MMNVEQSIDRHDIRQVLHEFLLGRGWRLDEAGDLCWLYPRAYGGKDASLRPDELD